MAVKQGYEKGELGALWERMHRIRETTRSCLTSCLKTTRTPPYAKQTLSRCGRFAQSSWNIPLRLNTAFPTVHTALRRCVPANPMVNGRIDNTTYRLCRSVEWSGSVSRQRCIDAGHSGPFVEYFE